MAVGTATGHVLLYDIRSREPLFVKDHLNKLPIKRLNFNSSHQAVYSLDSAMLKVWDETTGKQIAYVESTSNFNDFCTIPDTGMFFLAQEDVKMLTYYIPSMGPAPRWCSFLDNLTEEIESEVSITETLPTFSSYFFSLSGRGEHVRRLSVHHTEGTRRTWFGAPHRHEFA